MNDKAKIVQAIQDFLTRPKQKTKKQYRRRADAKQRTLFKETEL